MSARSSAARTTNDDTDSPASAAACSICLRSVDVSRASRRSALTATCSSLATYKCTAPALTRQARIYPLTRGVLGLSLLIKRYQHAREPRNAVRLEVGWLHRGGFAAESGSAFGTVVEPSRFGAERLRDSAGGGYPAWQSRVDVAGEGEEVLVVPVGRVAPDALVVRETVTEDVKARLLSSCAGSSSHEAGRSSRRRRDHAEGGAPRSRAARAVAIFITSRREPWIGWKSWWR